MLRLSISLLTAGLLFTTAAQASEIPSFRESYAAIVYKTYRDSHVRAKELQSAVDAFLAAPGEETMNAAKAAWLASREPYGQSEAFRFYGGPIDASEPAGPEPRLNSWPLDEAYIDYVEGNPESGIVQKLDTEISEETLAAANQADDESAVALGYHAIEFLLWGQDFDAAGPGNRPWTDYQSGTPVKDRRREYLRIVTSILVKDLARLEEAWKDGVADNYAMDFTYKADEKEILRRIITGLATLSGFELASERMATALDSSDQEDEHSCFSDNTHNDFLYNVQGIQNIFAGTYGDYKGTGLKDVIKAADPRLAKKLEQNIAGTLKAIQSFDAPIDSKILTAPAGSPGRAKMEEAIVLLQEQANLWKDAGAALGVAVDIVSE